MHSIVGRVAKIIPGHAKEYIKSMQYSSDTLRHLPEYKANEQHSHINERRVREMLELYRLPEDIHILILRRTDTVLNSPLGYCIAYVDQLKTGLRFPLFPLLLEILCHHQIVLSQLVPNAIRLIVGFECHYRNHRVVTFGFISCLFYMKSSPVVG